MKGRDFVMKHRREKSYLSYSNNSVEIFSALSYDNIQSQLH